VVIFAVRNATGNDIFFPRPQTSGLIHASITNGAGYATNFSLADLGDRRLLCRRVAPGQVCYVHVSNGALDLTRDPQSHTQRLALGTYSVVMSCENVVVSGTLTDSSNKSVQVSAWTGQLAAPPTPLTIISSTTPGR